MSQIKRSCQEFSVEELIFTDYTKRKGISIINNKLASEYFSKKVWHMQSNLPNMRKLYI